MYGMPEPEALLPSQYAATLTTAMSDAYNRVRAKTAQQLKHQSEAPRGKSKKLYQPWSRPFVVVKKLSNVTYRM